jgi:hypothetical protein
MTTDTALAFEEIEPAVAPDWESASQGFLFGLGVAGLFLGFLT